ncbi:MAG: hemolysin family protein [Ignavibacteriaceae bacterium]|nr:hemolysin family protein [Ignavibacteriaceae bacterium]
MFAVNLLLLLVLLLISAFFSGSEIAFVVSNKLKLEVKARKNNFAAKSAFYFVENPQDFFSTVLLGNSIVNIAFASISTVVLTEFFGLSNISILIISTLLLLMLGELMPKYFARELADRVILISSIPIRAMSFLLYPFIKVTKSVSAALTQSSTGSEERINYLFDKEDIGQLVEESLNAGVVNKSESDIISKVLDLGDQKVYDAMRPRTEIIGVEITQTIHEALSVFIDFGYSKLPVYEDNLDNIKGVIFAYDVFNIPPDLKSIMRETIFVPETKKTFDMLTEFLNRRASIAIVIDEFGGTAGIITMEDIMEELFGEIRDEYDVEEDICRKVADNAYLISGKVEIDFINEKYNLDIPQGDYGTISGFITSKIGRIPIEGENLTIDNFNILIVRATNIKIDLVKLIAINQVKLVQN